MGVLALSLLLCLVLPSYRVVLRRAEDGWRLNVSAVGLLADGAGITAKVTAELNRRAAA